jgi:hypothetical protein
LRGSTRFCVYQNQSAHFLDKSELDPHPFAHSRALFFEHPSGFLLRAIKNGIFSAPNLTRIPTRCCKCWSTFFGIVLASIFARAPTLILS